MSSTSSALMTGTKTPRCGSLSSRPSWISRCNASRTGPRLTPNVSASSTSLSWEPGGRTPSMTLDRIRSPTIDAKVARGIRVGVPCLAAIVTPWEYRSAAREPHRQPGRRSPATSQLSTSYVSREWQVASTQPSECVRCHMDLPDDVPEPVVGARERRKPRRAEVAGHPVEVGVRASEVSRHSGNALGRGPHGTGSLLPGGQADLPGHHAGCGIRDLSDIGRNSGHWCPVDPVPDAGRCPV